MKAQFILAAVLSLATVSAMADSHYKHHKHHKPYRDDKVTVIHHYHPAPRHIVQPRRAAPPPHYVRHHRPYAPRYVEHRPVVVTPPVQRVYYAPPRPVPLRPTANFSLSVNL